MKAKHMLCIRENRFLNRYEIMSDSKVIGRCKSKYQATQFLENVFLGEIEVEDLKTKEYSNEDVYNRTSKDRIQARI